MHPLLQGRIHTCTKESFVQVCMHTCTKGTFVTVMCLFQRFPLYKYACTRVQRPLSDSRYCFKGTLCANTHAYLCKGYLCSSNASVTKVPLVPVCMHTCRKCTFVTVMLLLQSMHTCTKGTFVTVTNGTLCTSTHAYLYTGYLCNKCVTKVQTN